MQKETSTSARLVYSSPELRVYGDVATFTRSTTMRTGANDGMTDKTN